MPITYPHLGPTSWISEVRPLNARVASSTDDDVTVTWEGVSGDPLTRLFSLDIMSFVPRVGESMNARTKFGWPFSKNVDILDESIAPLESSDDPKRISMGLGGYIGSIDIPLSNDPSKRSTTPPFSMTLRIIGAEVEPIGATELQGGGADPNDFDDQSTGVFQATSFYDTGLNLYITDVTLDAQINVARKAFAVGGDYFLPFWTTEVGLTHDD